MNFKTLFSWKDKTITEPPKVEEKKYLIGYEIHTSDGAKKRNMYQDVSSSNIEERAKIVKGEITEMMCRLEQASKKKQTFVEIESNVYRVADVKSITYIQLEMSQILHG